MKIRLNILSIALMLIFFSCVKKDHFGRSSEKKILSLQLQNQVGNTQINHETKTILITVNSTAMLSSLKAVEIIKSTFAKVKPDIGEAQNFTTPVTYTVIAEDGSTAAYKVSVKQEGTEPQLDNSSFDAWYTTPRGYQEPGIDANSIWATGNAGTITLGSTNVSPLVINGNDRAAKLVTLDLGNLAGAIGQRMGAGSMFSGKFQLDIANPLNSTKFGIPFSARPKKFSVKYAYSPGSPYINKTGQTLAQTDSCDIYLLLENRETTEVKRVATGWFRSGIERIDQFYTITIDLVYGPLSASVPTYQKPSNGVYAAATDKVTHITVVFSSSYNGALFEGGRNSTLVVNDFNLIY